MEYTSCLVGAGSTNVGPLYYRAFLLISGVSRVIVSEVGHQVAGPGSPDACVNSASWLREWILLISQFMTQCHAGQSTLGALWPPS